MAAGWGVAFGALLASMGSMAMPSDPSLIRVAQKSWRTGPWSTGLPTPDVGVDELRGERPTLCDAQYLASVVTHTALRPPSTERTVP